MFASSVTFSSITHRTSSSRIRRTTRLKSVLLSQDYLRGAHAHPAALHRRGPGAAGGGGVNGAGSSGSGGSSGSCSGVGGSVVDSGGVSSHASSSGGYRQIHKLDKLDKLSSSSSDSLIGAIATEDETPLSGLSSSSSLPSSSAAAAMPGRYPKGMALPMPQTSSATLQSPTSSSSVGGVTSAFSPNSRPASLRNSGVIARYRQTDGS